MDVCHSIDELSKHGIWERTVNYILILSDATQMKYPEQAYLWRSDLGLERR